MESVNGSEKPIRVIVNEASSGNKPGTYNVYPRRDDRGIVRLWCEGDNSSECIHVKYAWTMPEVQEKVQIVKILEDMENRIE